MDIFVVLEINMESGPGSSPVITTHLFKTEELKNKWVDEWNTYMKALGASETKWGWFLKDRSFELEEETCTLIE